MKAGTEPAEHTLTTPLARSEDGAGETKNVRPTASPNARGSNPRGIANTLLPCHEYVKPLNANAALPPKRDSGARCRTPKKGATGGRHAPVFGAGGSESGWRG
jgi:hypothetical protein